MKQVKRIFAFILAALLALAMALPALAAAQRTAGRNKSKD